MESLITAVLCSSVEKKAAHGQFGRREQALMTRVGALDKGGSRSKGNWRKMLG